MFPEDRVLVGVINRRRDLDYARTESWYRIPQQQMPNGVNAEYIAFFLSRSFKEKNGGIHYYAKRNGLELVYRKDLLTAEANHPRAGLVYYKVQLGELIEKIPPILNSTRRTIGFIYTTWDRFVRAHEIGDLYSKADYFVDRIYHALRNRGIQSQHTWSAEYRSSAAELRIMCQKGVLTASTEAGENRFLLDTSYPEDTILTGILAEIARQGGPVLVRVPLD
jgi:hypothetical protein